MELSQDSLGYINHADEIFTSEKQWKFTVDDIADHRGISAKLDRDIWLDWHDILSCPEEARMHMYPGKSGLPASLGIKHQRMMTWQAAIAVFDDMMEDVTSPLCSTTVKDMLKENKLPRPERLVLPTSNQALIKLFDALGIWKDGNSRSMLTAEWKTFAEMAREGAIVQPKKFLKNIKSISSRDPESPSAT